MVFKKTLFDDNQHMDQDQPKNFSKEDTPLEKLKSLEDKISTAIERVKTLKEDKTLLERHIKELERLLDEKNQELEQLRTDKGAIRVQLEALLNEIETLGSE